MKTTREILIEIIKDCVHWQSIDEDVRLSEDKFIQSLINKYNLQSHPQGLDLKELEKRLDDTLSKETPESLNSFLNSHPQSAEEILGNAINPHYQRKILNKKLKKLIIEAMQEYAQQDIKLPSDEEIEKACEKYNNDCYYGHTSGENPRYHYMNGINWLKELIKNKQ